MVGYYLTLIAKFYRLKFSKGPPHRIMQVALFLLILGLVSKLHAFTFVPSWLPPTLICAGGLAFSGFAYSLYRTMMSVD